MTALDALKQQYRERCIEVARGRANAQTLYINWTVDAVLKVIAADMESAIAAKGHHMSAPAVWRLEVPE